MKVKKIFEKAKKLRQEGLSFKEIGERLGISKSTASLWLRNIELSDKARERIQDLGIRGRERAIRTNRNKKYKEEAEIIKKIENRFTKIRGIDYKIACSLLYWCEGTKNKSNTSVSFTNADPEMISYFLKVFRGSFSLDEKKFRALVHLHEYHDAEKQLKFWSEVAKIPLNQFNKSYLKKNTGKNKKENYPGCINIKYSDSKIYKELMFTIKKIAKI